MTHPLGLVPRIALVTAFTVVLGCNMNKLTADMTSGPVSYGSVALNRESDLEFARAAFPASLKTIETFLVNSPKNEELLLLLARGYNAYALGFLERDLEKASLSGPEDRIESLRRRAVLHYLRGRDYGLRLLDRPHLEQAARSGDFVALDRELAQVDRDEVPALFWATYGWASAINLDQSDPEMVGALPAIERMMARVIELDPGYESGSPLVFQGVYYASKPVMAGGDPKKAKQYFDRAMEGFGEANLLIPYLYARFYATQVQDRELFDSMVGRVLAAELTRHPELRLLNEIARDLAEFWSAHADELIYQ